jgi:hypothetical protein
MEQPVSGPYKLDPFKLKNYPLLSNGLFKEDGMSFPTKKIIMCRSYVLIGLPHVNMRRRLTRKLVEK